MKIKINVRSFVASLILTGVFWIVFSLSALEIKDSTKLVFYKSFQVPLSAILLFGFSYYFRAKKRVDESLVRETFSKDVSFGFVGILSVLPTLIIFTDFVGSISQVFFIVPFVSIYLAISLLSFFAGLGIGEAICSKAKEEKVNNSSSPTKSFYEVGKNSAGNMPN